MEAWKTAWSVSLDGRDISSAMNPYLQSIDVTDKDGTASDTCALILDDSNGQFRMPRAGGSIIVRLEGVQVFEGTIDEINSTGGRSQGRQISINAKGFDTRGKIKSRLDFHLDNASLQEFLDAAARRAGLDRVIVDPAYGDTRRDYWSADGESFVHLVERIAREYGGSFKIRNDRAVLAQRGTGLSPSGKPMPSMTATWGAGGNLLSWDISPYVGRARGNKAKVKFYDRNTGKHEIREVLIEPENGAEDPAADLATIYTAADGAGADVAAKGKKSDSQRKSGEGSVTVTLMPEARVEGTVIVQGTRPGVDGPYRIAGVSHKLERNSGSVTTLELKQPGSGTGSGGDKRATAFDAEAFIAEQASANESERDQVDPGAPAF